MPEGRPTLCDTYYHDFNERQNCRTHGITLKSKSSARLEAFDDFIDSRGERSRGELLTFPVVLPLAIEWIHDANLSDRVACPLPTSNWSEFPCLLQPSASGAQSSVQRRAPCRGLRSSRS